MTSMRLQMLRWLTIEKFSAESGFTPDAVRSKIKRGDWLEGQVWIKAPDGRILIDTEGFEKWVTSQQSAFAPEASPRSKLISITGGFAAENVSSFNRQKKTSSTAND